jgi:hypothetical protein
MTTLQLAKARKFDDWLSQLTDWIPCDHPLEFKLTTMDINNLIE